ncbi:MAG: TonB-dependent receptor, partial [Candidatus Omnitrophica bacterium]|nr:TonB-dependent receptor [Candidatus Omnitrophota bacterium]
TGFELQQNYSPNETHLLTLGGNYIKDEVKSESTGNHAPEREAVFIQDQITFGKATLVLGGRVDDHSVYGTEFSPRIAARYALSEATTLRSSLGKAYRAPTVNDLYWYEDWGWGMGMFGNKDLKPERGISYDLGVEHKFSEGLSATITYFQNDVKDLISWVDMGGWRYEVQNIGKARLQGIETELKWAITKCLSFSVNHTYLNAEDRNTGKKLPYRPENRVGSLLSYAHPSGFKVQVEGEYNDVSYANVDNTNKVDEYFLLSLVVSKKINPKVELFAKGENLFGEEYEIIDGFPMPQTTVTVGLKASF